MPKDINLDVIVVVISAISWVIILMITFSYFIAYIIKKTFGVGSLLFYFGISTIIYFLFFFRLAHKFLTGDLFFMDCAEFFFVIETIRILTSTLLLISIWKQNDKTKQKLIN